jgi:hypothetical protein
MLGMGLRWLCRRPTARTQERHVGDCVARGGVGDCVGATVVSAAVERRRSSRHDVGGRDVIIHAFFVCVKIVCDVVPRVGWAVHESTPRLDGFGTTTGLDFDGMYRADRRAGTTTSWPRAGRLGAHSTPTAGPGTSH